MRKMCRSGKRAGQYPLRFASDPFMPSLPRSYGCHSACRIDSQLTSPLGHSFRLAMSDLESHELVLERLVFNSRTSWVAGEVLAHLLLFSLMPPKPAARRPGRRPFRARPTAWCMSPADATARVHANPGGTTLKTTHERRVFLMSTTRLLPTLWASFDRLQGEMDRLLEGWGVDLPRQLALAATF